MLPIAISALAAVLGIGMLLSRRLQHGYIDFLTPMLALYGLHYVTRGLMVVYLPDWLSLNQLVAVADPDDVAAALFLTAAGVAILSAAYLGANRLLVLSAGASALRQPTLKVAATLIGIGAACRLVLRLSSIGVVPLPDWAVTPVETFGWAALAGIFMASFRWGSRPIDGTDRQRSRLLVWVGVVLVILIDAKFAVSREAVLQPILTALLGRWFSAGVSLRRIVATTIVVALPIFVWISAMKTYHDYSLGPGEGYVTAIPAVHEQVGQTWVQFVAGTVQNRFHGLDSLIVVERIVPSLRPYEEGSVWSTTLLSAFVPRVLWPEKRVGWGTRFAVEFWGAPASSEGQAAVGISHLGNFYVYGGIWGCLIGMAVLGAGLGALARYLRQRGDVYGMTMFVLVSLTIFQIDRDLEMALGGVLKLLVIFWVVRFLNQAHPGAIVVRRPLAAGRQPLGWR